jgi:hypothetical protein
VKPNDLLGIATTRPDIFGPALHDFMKRATRGFAGMTAVCEDLPLADNRVTLSTQQDAHGVPIARVTHDTHAESVLLWQASCPGKPRIQTRTPATGRSAFADN